jgi:hypothetical protein
VEVAGAVIGNDGAVAGSVVRIAGVFGAFVPVVAQHTFAWVFAGVAAEHEHNRPKRKDARRSQ